MKRIYLMAYFVFIFSLVLIASCSNDFSTPTEVALSATSLNEAKSITINEEIVSLIEYYSIFNVNLSDSAKAIVSIEKGDTLYPLVYSIKFGTYGLKAIRGNILKGRLIASYNNLMFIQESTIKVTFDHFSINEDTIKKSITIFKNALIPNSLTISTNNLIVRKDGKTLISNSKLIRTRISNKNTPYNYWDDIFSITGSSEGINTEGKVFTSNIDQSNPLLITKDFPFIIKGTEIVSSENLSSILDYGDGTKDSIATVTINGVTKEITLKR